MGTVVIVVVRAFFLLLFLRRPIIVVGLSVADVVAQTTQIVAACFPRCDHDGQQHCYDERSHR
jgi:hypothetical protein